MGRQGTERRCRKEGTLQGKLAQAHRTDLHSRVGEPRLWFKSKKQSV
jgi:hypothetical protein